MRPNLRSKVTLLFMTFAVLLAMPTIAFADLVTVSDANTLQASGDATKQAGQTGSARFHLLVNDNATDPVNGCNANTSNKVKVTVASTAKDKNGNNLATSPVTFDSPGYVELEACDNPGTTTTIEGAKTLGYTVSSSAQVGDVITVTASASGGRQGGTGAYSYDTFTITVVAPPEQGTALSVSTASGTYGGTATLSAKLTSGSSNTAVAGKQVAFKLNGSSVGSASTGTDGVATLSNVSLANIPAGEYVDAVSASYAGTGTSCTSNCYGPSSGTAALSVDKANLTVTTKDETKIYGDANPAFSVSYSGFKNSDTASSLGGTLGFDTTADASSDVGFYDVTPKGLTSDNYNISFVAGKLEVTKAPLTIKADDASREYGDPNPAFSGSIVSGLKNNDALNVSASSQATAASDVGTYAIVPSLNGLKSGNYEVTAQNGTLQVTAAPLTIKGNDDSREYGDPNPVFTGSIIAGTVKNSDALSVSASSAANAGSPVGSYAIVPVLNGAKASNYNVTAQNGTLIVTKAPLTVKANDDSREYGEANPNFTGSITGVKNSDPISASYSSAANAVSPVGSYAIIPQVNATAAVLSNYQQPNLINGTLTVTRAPLTVNTDSKTREYGDSNPIFTGSIVGIKNSDPISASYSSLATQDSDFGSYAITATLSDPQQRLGNYIVTNDGGTLTITKAPLTIKANDATRFYGDPNPALTGFIVSGLKNNDALSVSASTAATESSPVGSYPIVPSVSGAKVINYTVTALNGTLTVGAWKTTGFYAPVDMLDSLGNPIVNTIKGGSTVPMKFEVYKGTTELKDTSAIKSTTYAKSSVCNGAYTDEIEVVLTGNTSLRFDTTSDQFIYNWKTPSGAGCYKSVMTTQDGSQLVAYFKTR